VFGVGPDRADEQVLLVIGDEHDLDLAPAAQPGRGHPVHAVDHPVGPAVHGDRRQRAVELGQRPHVPGVAAGQPG
jgi:hypothetical protein